MYNSKYQNIEVLLCVQELFSEVGDLKRYSIHYDRSGRSKGTAEVVFSRRGDAVAAVKRYNNVQLDGKPMKIEIVGTNIGTAAGPPPPATNGSFGNSNGFASSRLYVYFYLLLVFHFVTGSCLSPHSCFAE
ncbi:hypothetical protein CsatA_023232 [Cannabis sativa]